MSNHLWNVSTSRLSFYMVGMGVTQSNFGTENLRSFIENILPTLKCKF
jgi:hypothetical protein